MQRLRTTLPLLACLALAACSTESDVSATETGTGSSTSSEAADSAQPTDPNPSSEAAIEDAFRALQEACTEKDGAVSLALLAAPTRDRWVHIKGLALHADKESLQREGLVTQLHTLVLRASADFETLESLDEVGLIQYALDRNLLGGTLILGNSLREIQVDGDSATSRASHEASGKPLEVRYSFAREDGAWKVDLVPAYTMADEILHTKLQMPGSTSVEHALFMLVGSATGTGGTTELWVPLSETLGD